MHTHTHTHTQGDMCLTPNHAPRIHTYMHTHTHTHTGRHVPNAEPRAAHTYIHAHTHTHTHTQGDMCLTPNHARGAGTKFGPGIARHLLGKWGLKTLVRSHQCVPKGWEQIQVLSLLALLVQKYTYWRCCCCCSVGLGADGGTRFTCFTGTKVHILTLLLLLSVAITCRSGRSSARPITTASATQVAHV